MRIHKLISTVFGIGYVSKGGGTIAALVCCVIWYLLRIDGYATSTLLATMLVLVVGIWSANVVEQEWGIDSSKVVIDEIAGMMLSLLFIPFAISYIIAAFVLFRFFDIVKPLYIKKAEQLPGGWGVMLDDVQAGIYANLMMQGIVFFKLF
ncbi:MAG TPA: phosphatidylglycerophosphatase A [Cyclobacteriaceae bacterium]|nr:phosphatidylglycerophosphatase A [Cyclobacteriaceae bacterium]HNP06322.1 phosphatidylglycerophosphatase A [Cyclobacteriaceae bacterium]